MIVMPILSSYCQTKRHVIWIRNLCDYIVCICASMLGFFSGYMLRSVYMASVDCVCIYGQQSARSFLPLCFMLFVINICIRKLLNIDTIHIFGHIYDKQNMINVFMNEIWIYSKLTYSYRWFCLLFIIENQIGYLICIFYVIPRAWTCLVALITKQANQRFTSNRDIDRQT